MCTVCQSPSIINREPAHHRRPTAPGHRRATGLFTLAVLVTLTPLFAPAARADLPLRARYEDDFILESEDGAYQLKIRGNLHFDARWYQGEEEVGAPDSFDIRRARIDLQGRLHRWFTFRVQPEFAGNPYIRNAWADASAKPWVHLRVGQMKVPFSTSWVTLDNNVNFVERGSSTPVYPFFDRGVLAWGELLDSAVVYNVGAFTGAGVDIDVDSGDVDDHKDLAGRLFLQPFRPLSWPALKNLTLVADGTWGKMTIPTGRFETGGMRSANFESAVWRWRTEQVLGSDGRTVDRITASVDQRLRWGAELHYVYGPFALSTEYLECHYRDVVVYHELVEGSRRLAREQLFDASGAVRSWSSWVSFHLTGEEKTITNFGWKAVKPRAPLGEGGLGALELLARYSRTWTDQQLFDGTRVTGYDVGGAGLPAGYDGATPGAGHSLTAAILDGAHDLHEVTLGLAWTINPMVKLQLNEVFLWAPADDRDGDGEPDNLLVSGAKSAQADPDLKNLKVAWENAVMGRLIFKL